MTVLDSASGHIRTIDLSSGVVSLLTSQPGATGLWIDSSSNVYATIVNQVFIVESGMPVPKAGNGASLQAGALDSITAATLANVGVNLPLLQATAATVAMEETRCWPRFPARTQCASTPTQTCSSWTLEMASFAPPVWAKVPRSPCNLPAPLLLLARQRAFTPSLPPPQTCLPPYNGSTPATVESPGCSTQQAFIRPTPLFQPCSR